MKSELLHYPLLAHLLWLVFLYALLTVFRAPDVWNIGKSTDGSNPWKYLETRVSVNLSNQFEWPMLFYVICVLAICNLPSLNPAFVWAAWLFVAGRILHSGVQILTNNVRLRGIVFTINFLAVLGMWLLYFADAV